jgi:hypothetical protein
VTQGHFARILYPGVLYFSRTPAAITFAEKLADTATEALAKDLAVTDDYILQEALTDSGNDLTVAILSAKLMGTALVHGTSGNVPRHRSKVLQHIAPRSRAAENWGPRTILELQQATSEIAARRRQAGVIFEYIVAKCASVFLRSALIAARRVPFPIFNMRRIGRDSRTKS